MDGKEIIWMARTKLKFRGGMELKSLGKAFLASQVSICMVLFLGYIDCMYVKIHTIKAIP